MTTAMFNQTPEQQIWGYLGLGLLIVMVGAGLMLFQLIWNPSDSAKQSVNIDNTSLNNITSNATAIGDNAIASINWNFIVVPASVIIILFFLLWLLKPKD